MGENGRYDVGQIEGSEAMSTEEREYFSKFWTSMGDQGEIIADKYDIDSETMQAEFAYIMKNLIHDKGEYIVNGAPLKCSMQTDIGNIQKLTYKGKEIISKPTRIEEMSALQLPKNREENINGQVFANIKDAAGGLMDARLVTLMEDKGKEKEINITSFGNCKWIEKDNITQIENMVENIFRILKGIYYKGRPHFTREEIAEIVIKMLEQGKGTCYCYMALNNEWENLPAGYDFIENSYHYESPSIGFDGNTYMQFNGKEGINMMSMLFCRHGGIICAKESGQEQRQPEEIFTDLEKDLIAKFPNKFAYVNWSQEKKKCAEEIWNKFYVEEGYDACFVAGLIGNMFGEGSCGLLQYPTEGVDWNIYMKDNIIYVGGEIISNIEQARIACINAPDGYGIGMIQWSQQKRKEELFYSYQQNQASDGKLSSEQLMRAEIEYMFIELADLGNVHDFKDIVPEYEEFSVEHKNIDDNITFAACILFRDYETPSSYKDVNKDDYTVVEEKWDEARDADSGDAIPSICQRIIAAKIAYEEFAK